MTKPKPVSSYPPHYLQAVEQAFARGKFVIPCVNSSVTSVRMQFYGFLEVLRNSDMAELADSLSVLTDKKAKTVTLIRKENTAAAQDVANALKQAHPILDPSPALALDEVNNLAADFLTRLGK